MTHQKWGIVQKRYTWLESKVEGWLHENEVPAMDASEVMGFLRLLS